MKKIILLIEPVEGHFNPFVPIISKLVLEQYDIVCITGTRFKQRIEQLGAGFHPLPSRWDPGEQDTYDFMPELKNKTGLAQIKYYLQQVMYDQVPDILTELQQVLEKFPADIVMCDTFMVAGNWITELGGPPSIRLSVLPLSLPGKNIAPFGLGLLPGKTLFGHLRNNFLNIVFEKILFKDVQAHVNHIRHTLGLVCFDRYFFSQGYAVPNLVLHTSTPLFEYSRTQMPDNFRYIGHVPTVVRADYTMPKWWPKAGANKPVILINQGTVAINHADLILPAIEALTDEPVVVVIVPVQSGELQNLPEHMHAEAYIPFGNIFPHIDIMITNGGLGATQSALAHGIPVIVAGATEDKMEVAARVEHSGAGINLRQQSPSAKAIKQAVRSILHNPVYSQKARELQEDYAHYDAVSLAVASIEQLIDETQALQATK